MGIGASGHFGQQGDELFISVRDGAIRCATERKPCHGRDEPAVAWGSGNRLSVQGVGRSVLRNNEPNVHLTRRDKTACLTTECKE